MVNCGVFCLNTLNSYKSAHEGGANDYGANVNSRDSIHGCSILNGDLNITPVALLPGAHHVPE